MQNSLVPILPLHQRVRRQRVDQVVQLEGDVVPAGERGEDAGWRGAVVVAEGILIPGWLGRWYERV